MGAQLTGNTRGQGDGLENLVFCVFDIFIWLFFDILEFVFYFLFSDDVDFGY